VLTVPADDYDLFLEFDDFGGNDNDYTAGHFQEFLEIYRESGASQEDPDADAEMFFQFLNAFVPDVESHDRDYWAEMRESFYDLAGLAGDENIDWEIWREAIGYGRD
jgi:hypothetical protein